MQQSINPVGRAWVVEITEHDPTVLNATVAHVINMIFHRLTAINGTGWVSVFESGRSQRFYSVKRVLRKEGNARFCNVNQCLSKRVLYEA
jgi:hypothetical protein